MCALQSQANSPKSPHPFPCNRYLSWLVVYERVVCGCVCTSMYMCVCVHVYTYAACRLGKACRQSCRCPFVEIAYYVTIQSLPSGSTTLTSKITDTSSITLFFSHQRYWAVWTPWNPSEMIFRTSEALMQRLNWSLIIRPDSVNLVLERPLGTTAGFSF